METKEKTPATALDVEKVLKDLLRENVVGLTEESAEGGFDFFLPNRQRFHISVREMDGGCLSTL